MMNRQSITVFFPAYNDSATIGNLVENALDVLPQLTEDFEILVINDGSTDETANVLNSLAKQSKNVRVVHHEINLGYGGALRSGFANASKDLVFYTDGDGQYDVREILRLFPLMKEDVDVVNGYKLKRSDNIYRIIIGKLYGKMARLLFGLPIRDVDCDFRLIRRAALQKISLNESSGVICVELVGKLAKSGAIFAETPVNHFPRLHGSSEFFTIGRVSKTLYDFIRLWLKLKILAKSENIQHLFILSFILSVLCG